MTIDLQIGDNREILLKYPDDHFDCVITSPPYWGLRDYQTIPVIFDAAPDCEHTFETTDAKLNRENRQRLTGSTAGNDNYQKGLHGFGESKSGFCSKCGAWGGQLGLEPTPELFIKHLVDTFDIIKIKLKNEGNCFVNLGDTYSANRGYQVDGTKQVNGSQPKHGMSSDDCGVPPKCLCMIPERFAWGMIERGWILRNKIIWEKVNHMPESVTDRLTKSHEVIYHFVKQQKYYYDLDAIREPHKTQENRPMGIIRSRDWGYNGKYEGNKLHKDFNTPRARTQRKHDDNGSGCDGSGIRNHSGNSLNNPKGKNPGDVWAITTQAYSKAHFATFPLELVRRPILAGCPTDGWVLDPFAGSGTVGEFCNNNYRNAVLIELNPEYKPLIVDRANLKQIPLSKMFSYVR